MEQEFRPFWTRFFSFNWRFGLFLLFIVCIPRFLLVLHANESGKYGAIGILMLISALTPFIFLSKSGRRQIGIRKTTKSQWLLISLITGIAASAFLYVLGVNLYGNSFENWYVYIGRSYNIPAQIEAQDRNILFLVMAVTGMTFSPIGEEFFFRGIVHGSFENSLGEKKASLIDSSAFALTHISHFGLVFINDQWRLLGMPTLLWVLSMFLLSVLFFLFKKYTNSIWTAVLCHAGFNLGMIWCIFFLF